VRMAVRSCLRMLHGGEPSLEARSQYRTSSTLPFDGAGVRQYRGGLEVEVKDRTGKQGTLALGVGRRTRVTSIRHCQPRSGG
jgi:hypothetical protein